MCMQAAIWYAINNYQFQDAIFLAERLHAESEWASQYVLCVAFIYLNVFSNSWNVRDKAPIGYMLLS